MLPSACGLGQHFQALGHSFSPYGPPSRQITYIYYDMIALNQGNQNPQNDMIASFPFASNGKYDSMLKSFTSAGRDLTQRSNLTPQQSHLAPQRGKNTSQTLKNILSSLRVITRPFMTLMNPSTSNRHLYENSPRVTCL